MKRVITAAILIPVVLLTTLFAPDWIFAAVIGLVCALAVEEFLSLGVKSGIGRPGRWFLAPAGIVGFSFFGGLDWAIAVFGAATISLMSVSIFTNPMDAALGRVAIGLAGVAYCSMTLGFLVLTSRRAIIVLFAIIWAGDTTAYYLGRAFGRHLLAPNVSPKKTVEGAVAGLIGSVVAGTAGGMWILGEPWLKFAGISALIAVVGQVGDLAESVLKRSAGVKDSSSILPGHGGILDRLDSLFFATPLFFWLLNI